MRFPENSQQLDNFLISPVPQINWRRSDGMPFPNKIKLRKFNGVLEIPNFQQEDTGSYECIAENSRGKNVARGRLTYYGKQQPWGHCFVAFIPSSLFLGAGVIISENQDLIGHFLAFILFFLLSKDKHQRTKKLKRKATLQSN